MVWLGLLFGLLNLLLTWFMNRKASGLPIPEGIKRKLENRVLPLMESILAHAKEAGCVAATVSDEELLHSSMED